MRTMDQVQAEYRNACAELGHLINNKRKIDARLAEVDQRIAALDSEAAAITKAEATKAGAANEPQEKKED